MAKPDAPKAVPRRPRPPAWNPGPVLISHARIRGRVRALAGAISRHYREEPPMVLGLLNGALFFLADLLRHLPANAPVECWRLRSYPGTARQSSGRIEGLEAGFGSFKGRHVLMVDDVLDSGLTLNRVRARLLLLGARSVRICVLLRKRIRRAVPVRADWVGFDIGREFVIGYGLDYDGRYRQLPDIHVLHAPAISRVASR